ncbi:MAG: PD-(D/E)XK nuclease family protein [Elusimicrobia bacterium]|nr:PD-(D/E)XK nuclease family protein [Elusimicrobiota bacterium]
MNRIITYNFGENLIQNLADFVDKNYLQKTRDVSRLAFVFGGKRPSLFLKKELSVRSGKSFLSPKFFSINEFIQYIVQKKDNYTAPSDLDMSYAIYNIAKKTVPEILKGKEKFSQFMPWAREILAFIDKLDVENIKLESLKNIQFKAEIGYDVPETINKLLENIITIRNSFHKTLTENKTYSNGIICMLASQYIKEANFDEFDDILFCDLFYLNKTEQIIIKELYNKDKAILFFQGSRKEWPILENASKIFGYEIGAGAKTHDSDSILVHSGFDVHSQVCLVREILQNILKQSGDPEKTVIVLPDSNNAVPLLSEISSIVKEFNVSLGYPLRRSSVYSLFEHIFSSQATKNADDYYTKDYLKALNHPFTKNLKLLDDSSATRVIVHKIEELLTSSKDNSLSGRLFVKLKDIESSKELFGLIADNLQSMGVTVKKDEVENVIVKLHNILFYSWEKIDNFREFSLKLGEFLDKLMDSGMLEKYPPNLKIVDKLFSIRDELGNSSFCSEIFAKEDIFTIFKSKIRNEIISFSGSPLKGLQILGLYETRGLNFENVIIMDVNESVLPRLSVNEPLIPGEIMLSLGYNSLENEEEIQHYHFKRLISAAKRVHLVYNENKSDDKEKSRFIEELIWNRQKEKGKIDAVSIQKAGFKAEIQPRKKEIEKNSKIIDFLKGYPYSPTSIDAYLECPMKFYYKYALGLEEKDELLDEPESADVGNFVHNLLEETYRMFVGSKFLIDDKFESYFFKRFDEYFEEFFGNKVRAGAFLLKEVLEYRLKKYLRYEKEARQIKIAGLGVNKILALERTLKETIKLDCGDFKFNLRIDRIDQLQDGTILIVDYKTGSGLKIPAKKLYDAGPEEFQTREDIRKKIKSFQLPLYVHLAKGIYKTDSVNAGLYLLKETGINYLFDDKAGPKSREISMKICMSSLNFILSEILNPAKPFAINEEDTRACEYCPFTYLCR